MQTTRSSTQPWAATLHMTSVSHGSCCSTFKGDLTRPCIPSFRSAVAKLTPTLSASWLTLFTHCGSVRTFVGIQPNLVVSLLGLPSLLGSSQLHNMPARSDCDGADLAQAMHCAHILPAIMQHFPGQENPYQWAKNSQDCQLQQHMHEQYYGF